EGLESLGELFRIMVAHAEADAGAGVLEDGVVHLGVARLELVETLMAKRETERELAGAGQERGHGRRDEGLEFVDREDECSSLLFLRVLATEGDLVELRHEKTPEEGGILLADRALGELREEDLPVIHDLPEIEGGILLRHDAPDEPRTKEGI